MSIQSEIDRISTAKAELKSAIESKGVSVPENTSLSDYGDLVEQIQQGGPYLPLTGGTVNGDVSINGLLNVASPDDVAIPRMQFLPYGASLGGYMTRDMAFYAAGVSKANSSDLSTAIGMVVAGSLMAASLGVPEGITLMGAPINVSGQKISLVGEPAADTDAATKGYVDGLIGDIGTLLDSINGEVV